jgi:drug/metabolite transporter (DMT)-like permease
VNPIVALFLGWIFLDEKLSSRTIFASGIILVGVILMTLGRKKTSKVVDFENT